jgi:hypothetical protein
METVLDGPNRAIPVMRCATRNILLCSAVGGGHSRNDDVVVRREVCAFGSKVAAETILGLPTSPVRWQGDAG